jgi:hypothetical protein
VGTFKLRAIYFDVVIYLEFLAWKEQKASDKRKMFDGWLYLLIDGHLYNLPKIMFMEMISFSLNVDHQAQLPVTIWPRPIAKICNPKAGWLIWSRVHGSVQTLADRPPKQTNNTASNLCDKALCQTSPAQWSGFRNLAVRESVNDTEWMGSMLLGN